MHRTIVNTADGSVTVAIPELKVTYHSHHGAVQESVHVFIQAGLQYALSKTFQNPFAVLEMGFGTGLNALLTLMKAEQLQQPMVYTAVERYPLQPQEWQGLDYDALLPGTKAVLHQLHQAAWNTPVAINSLFTLQKEKEDFLIFDTNQRFHLVYFDAFAPAAQPQLWSVQMFQKLFNLLLPGGVLVTYCSKGAVRRAMQAAGFTVTKLPGPPGKREMVRAEAGAVDSISLAGDC